MAKVFGPYATEQEAIADARDVLDLPPADRQWDRANDAKLYTACIKAGVELGEYDERILSWLAKWEPQAVQVIVGMISRASRPQEIAGGDQ